jgi:hypothetical protein
MTKMSCRPTVPDLQALEKTWRPQQLVDVALRLGPQLYGRETIENPQVREDQHVTRAEVLHAAADGRVRSGSFSAPVKSAWLKADHAGEDRT